MNLRHRRNPRMISQRRRRRRRLVPGRRRLPEEMLHEEIEALALAVRALVARR
jgi:hypothetical protein